MWAPAAKMVAHGIGRRGRDGPDEYSARTAAKGCLREGDHQCLVARVQTPAQPMERYTRRASARLTGLKRLIVATVRLAVHSAHLQGNASKPVGGPRVQ